MNPARWLHIALTALLLAAGFGAWTASGQSAQATPVHNMTMTSAMQHDCCDQAEMACCDNGHEQCGPACAASHCVTSPVGLVPAEPAMPQPVATTFPVETPDSYTSRLTPPLTPPPLV